ncbi:hypothetical protein J8F10_28885 [Gemmata sp. G18]|uniref:Squalene cyclase C-terminal domain-containing protein n=1 Tax=Gemmata palustris TaxID=2822762 RepID=A0ABS5BZX3_9BACT|nr:hypothetical protein [Gemmata palustris]MBP3959279.1 hypothetical protein [Gemmata palustris]
MFSKFARVAGLCGALLVVSSPAAPGATPKEIDRALKAGTDALKSGYNQKGGAGFGSANLANHGVGPTCLTGLALLEAGTPIDDPAVKTITARVRDAAYTQNQTYQVALCLMYLDRLGDAADVPVIQMLAARLIVGQTAGGGWTYQTCGGVSAETATWLKNNLQPNQLVAGANGKPPKLHPDVEKYGQALVADRTQGGATVGFGDDNSNTQFAIIAIWMSRKHGAPVEDTLDRIEKRFMGSQDPRTGNWSYSGGMPGPAGVGGMPGSPSMYCAGLLGMATGLARREDRRLKSEAPAPKPEAPAKPDKPTDPFYNPPAGKDPPKKPARAAPDARDLVVQLAFAGLGLTMGDQIQKGQGLLTGSGAHGTGDLYFLWSLERVGVVYGMDKIGKIDWYDIGSTAIVRSQGADGTWTVGGSYGTEVNTAFAVLFLCRSNLARDLSNKVQKDPTSTEMKAGTGPAATDLLPNRPTTPVSAAVPVVNLPNPTGDEGVALASKLLKASGSDWAKLLAESRDAKGTVHTRALAVTAAHADGDRKAAAREALAERLCRMAPATLRTMLKASEVELRRAAALACAMKDDKEHIPDLIELITDADDSVVRAAKAGLKSLSGKDFGPASGAPAAQKAAAATAWREWYAKEKK